MLRPNYDFIVKSNSTWVLWWCVHSLLHPLNVPTHTFHPMYVMTHVHFVHYIIVTNPHIVPEFFVHPRNGVGGLGWTNSTSTFYVTHRPMYFLSTLGQNVTIPWCRKLYLTFPNSTLYVTERFVTKRFVTERFVTERFVTERFVTERFVTERFVTERFVTERFVTERFVTEQFITERYVTEL